jgi:predicted metal-dependent enzyme (double-stranded beta helix superfamily)
MLDTATGSLADARAAACAALIREARAITDAEGVTPAALARVKERLIALAALAELFAPRDFPLPEAHGRSTALDIGDDDGFGLYLTVGLPGKEAGPHDHGIWCVNAGVSGTELHRFFRRTDDGSQPGRATLEEISAVEVGPGTGMAMADHDIHSTVVTGDAPAYALALYGYALDRFPSVIWYNRAFGTARAIPSKRAPRGA